MNRPIKFRIWDGQKMHHPSDFNSLHRLVTEQTSIYPQYESIRTPADAVLMQFTGLLDADGKEIYEGDVVQIGERLPERYQVAFDPGSFRLHGRTFDAFNGDHLSSFHQSDRQILGNAYENPDLLAKP